MIIQILSENDYLLDILHKNPNTDFGLYCKKLRNGQVIGNAVSKHQYDVVFQDTRYSYLPEESNQIDFQSYCSPLVILHICNAFFKDQLKQRQTYFAEKIKWLNQSKQAIDNTTCTIKVHNLYLNSHWYSNNQFLLEKYFKNIKTTLLAGKNASLEIEANSVFEAINYLSLVAVLAHITNEYGEFTYIDDLFAQKYARILTNIQNVPYFVFYLFTKRAVKSERQFQEIKVIFEAYFKTQGIEANLQYYGTQDSRINFALEHLAFDTPILDIGSGEFQYYKRFMGKKFKQLYFATDISEKVAQFYPIMKARYAENNLVFFSHWEDFTYQGKVNILLSEVIEHNSLEDAEKLIKKALKLNFNKIVITTPNSAFNSFYFEEEDNAMRHDDHHFELDTNAFESFIKKCIDSQANTTFYGIGDSINGIQPTQAVIIEKK